MGINMPDDENVAMNGYGSGDQTGMPKFVKPLTFITENQKKWYDVLSDPKNKIILCHAVAGVGKTHITLYKALEFIYKKDYAQRNLVVINPTVDVGNESPLGFLPGDLENKIEYYNESAHYVLKKIVTTSQKIDELLEKEKLQYRVLNFLRGLNIENTVVVLDEAQNASPKQIKTLMTRINDDTKLIIQGDLSQCDKYRDYRDSGFFDVWKRLKGVPGVGYMEFTPHDVIRSQIVKDVLARYAKEENIILNGFH